MSENVIAEKNVPSCDVSCWAWPAIVAVVLLRLCIGWHFFNEGIKKVEVDGITGEWRMVFSAEGFLNGAKGPFADLYHNQAPTTHEWRKNLAVANKLDPAKSEKLAAWVGTYVKRRQGELTNSKPTEPQFAEFSPAASWGEQIRSDWKKTLERLSKIKTLTKEQLAAAEQVFKKYELYLADFLAEEALDIEAYQHEMYKLETSKQVPGFDEVPFEIARVADQQASVDRSPNRWVAQMKKLDADFRDELREVVAVGEAGSKSLSAVDAAVANPEITRLNRTNVIVTCIVTGVGVCLLLGLFTRVAAIVGALFLLSVIFSQPTWVPDANTMVFYYQLVEVAALIFLAAVGAGRWAGLDYIIQGLWARRRGTHGAPTK